MNLSRTRHSSAKTRQSFHSFQSGADRNLPSHLPPLPAARSMCQLLYHKPCTPASYGGASAGNCPLSKTPPASCPLPEPASAPSVLKLLSEAASPRCRKLPRGISVSSPVYRRTSGTLAKSAPGECSYPCRTLALPSFPKPCRPPAPLPYCQTLYKADR